MKPKKRTIIVPCYNEALSITATIKRLKESDSNLKIIVVDNCSTDNTAAIAKKLGVLVVKEPRKGKGFAFRAGIKHLDVDCQTVLMTDGDDTYLVNEDILKQSFKLVEEDGYDMVIGARNKFKYVQNTRTSHFRPGHKLGNAFFSSLYTKLFGLQISDALSGFRVMSRGFINSFLAGASEFELETELNAHAYLLDCSIIEVSVPYAGRLIGSNSKLSTYKDGWKILRKHLIILKNERPNFVYRLFSLPWLVIGVALSFRVLNDYFETGLVPKFPSLIAAVGAYLISLIYWATGMILERVRVQRVAFARFTFLH